ncbi:MAG: hypothetical protein HOA19_05700 [Candidatus Marinimicrobia bacterium]|jgi:hypothetical protein|nr:hypothetical protein [Candidatus Neomarinimicrobiota bacterium]MBT6866824.1 hypothetical protein [Candidatus Neomarinimicrobiota bacterium]|tara:strand:+ start:9349 stop:9900 length:552 start_codon:yes stop_codon:yes gene_type:complete
MASSQTSQLESIDIMSMANGIVLTLEMDSIPKSENFTAWQANSNWFYITLYNVKGDSSQLRPKKLPDSIRDFQIISTNESIQLGLRLFEPIENHEFSSSEDENLIVASLHYSRVYLAQLDTIEKMELGKERFQFKSSFRDWLYHTGRGLTVTGLLKDSDNRMNLQTQIGLGLVVSTYFMDLIW